MENSLVSGIRETEQREALQRLLASRLPAPLNPLASPRFFEAAPACTVSEVRQRIETPLAYARGSAGVIFTEYARPYS